MTEAKSVKLRNQDRNQQVSKQTRDVAWLAGDVAWLAGDVAWLAGDIAWLAGDVAFATSNVSRQCGRAHCQGQERSTKD
jgi:hypothetical protein